jgi:hypothetical protein
MVRLSPKAALWLWTKVGLVLVALDLVLFRGGLFWPLTAGLEVPAVTGWPVVYRVARVIETATPRPDTALIVGSSVVLLGVVEPLANATAAARGVPARLTKLSMFGASATDAALLAWSGRRLRPWLVIYGAAPRDFGRELERRDSPAARVFYDASLALPALPRESAEDVLAAWVKRGWKLYRYQFFARAALETGARQWLGRLASPTSAFAAAPMAAPALPPESRRWFGPGDGMTPERYALWERWRATRRFDDYLAYLNARGIDLRQALSGYTAANLGLDGNPHVDSLRWMLATLPGLGARVVVVAFPENPVFREPEARSYVDPALSDAWVAVLAREAAARGARFVDLRDLLVADEFHDALHVNLEGNGKLSARIGEIVAEEWRAR